MALRLIWSNSDMSGRLARHTANQIAIANITAGRFNNGAHRGVRRFSNASRDPADSAGVTIDTRREIFEAQVMSLQVFRERHAPKVALDANQCQGEICELGHCAPRKGGETVFMIKNRIAKLRLAKKLTQAQLAEMCGTDAGNISRIEKGTQMPRAEMIAKLVSALDTPYYAMYMPDRQAEANELAERIERASEAERTVLRRILAQDDVPAESKAS